MPRHLKSTCLCVGLLIGCSQKSDLHPVARTNGQPITQVEWETYTKLKHLRVDSPMQMAKALDDYVSRVGLAGAIEAEKLLDAQQIQTEVADFKTQILISRYFDKFLEGKVTDQAVQEYYEDHAEEYPERKVHAAAILFRTRPRMTDDERRARLTAAQDAYSQVRAGKDFAAIASAVSEDKASSKLGGDLGWLGVGAINPVFSRRAFALTAGEVSEPFETQAGIHIVKALEAVQMVRKPLTLVQGEIRNKLRAAAKKEEMARLMDKAAIELDGKPRVATTDETVVNAASANRK